MFVCTCVCVCACNCHACICMDICCCFCVCYYNYLKNTPISASTAPAKLFKCFCVRGLQVKSNTHTRTRTCRHQHSIAGRYSEGYTRTGGLVIQSQKHTQQLPFGCSTGAVRDSRTLYVCVCGSESVARAKGWGGGEYVPCVSESARVPG